MNALPNNNIAIVTTRNKLLDCGSLRTRNKLLDCANTFQTAQRNSLAAETVHAETSAQRNSLAADIVQLPPWITVHDLKC